MFIKYRVTNETRTRLIEVDAQESIGSALRRLVKESGGPSYGDLEIVGIIDWRSDCLSNGQFGSDPYALKES